MVDPLARLSRLQPAGAVLVWDARTETFAPRVPAPHSSLLDGATQSHVPALEASSPTTSCTSPRKRTRHLSYPESILDFDEFLKQMERERTSIESHERHPNPTSNQSKPPVASMESQVPVSSPAKPNVKNPLKVVLKEVLGGGGNNHGTNIPKDGVVHAFGRGGVARSPLKTKATPAVVNNRRDPYYAHVAVGSPPSPTSFFFPPNSNTPFTRKGSVVDPYTGLHSPGEGHLPVTPRGLPASARPVAQYFADGYNPHAYDYSHYARPNTPSTSPSMSSTDSNGLETPQIPRRRTQPAVVQAQSKSNNVLERPRMRPRAKSMSSTTSSTREPLQPLSSQVAGRVFLHPAQAAMEAKLAAQSKRRSEDYKDSKSLEPDGVRVVVQPVLSAEERRRVGRDVEVVSGVDSDEEELFSLSGFPLPPTKVSTLDSAPRERLKSLPSDRPNFQYQSLPTPPAQHSALKRSRTTHRGRLPTMPSPITYDYPIGSIDPPPHFKSSSRPTSPLAEHVHLPPPPAIPPPTLDSPRSRRPSGPPPNAPLPPVPSRRSSLHRRGSHTAHPPFVFPPNGATLPTSYGAITPPQTTPLDPNLSSNMNTLLSSLQNLSIPTYFPPMGTNQYSAYPGVFVEPDEEQLMLQEALERERQMLEERVRGLMWLVDNLQGNEDTETQSLQPEQNDGRLRAPSPGGTSSSSTERATSYLPYVR